MIISYFKVLNPLAPVDLTSYSSGHFTLTFWSPTNSTTFITFKGASLSLDLRTSHLLFISDVLFIPSTFVYLPPAHFIRLGLSVSSPENLPWCSYFSIDSSLSPMLWWHWTFLHYSTEHTVQACGPSMSYHSGCCPPLITHHFLVSEWPYFNPCNNSWDQHVLSLGAFGSEGIDAQTD